MGEHTDNTINRIAKNIWQASFGHLLHTDQERVEVSEAEQREQLNDLLSTICQAFFEQLIELQTAFASIPLEIAQAKQDAQKSFRDAFDQSILKYLDDPTQQDEQDAVSSIMKYIHKNILSHISFPACISILRTIFLKEAPRTENLQLLRPHQGIHTVIACIATAIQDTAIATPPRYYQDIEPVPIVVKQALIVILEKIEAIRQAYLDKQINNEPPKLRELIQARRELKVQIARAEDLIWLPFNSPVTAPLSDKADLCLYARSKDETKRLAYQIIMGDGVFLIAGYRGVGKSTFINQALSLLSKFEACQKDSQPWHVIPISVSLAKASSVSNVLRLCIRRLYEMLMEELSDINGKSHANKWLTEKEREHLSLAYFRSVYKVNVQQGDSVATLKHIEAQVEASLKFTGNLPLALSTAVNTTTNTKASKDWNKKTERTIALPDYDEDKAEDDIVRLIRMLAKPRRTNEGEKRIKLVFIFDEMDKMEVKEQKELTNQLKNLFLERNTVFLLVTSKEFYYLWWEDRKVEDAVLASYFSWIKMIPLFTSEDTKRLLEGLISIKSLNFSEDEKDFVEALARYLTYRAAGIPRDIIRELQSIQQSEEDRLQPYLTDRLEQRLAILVYAEIQRVLEDLLKLESSTSSSSTSTGSISRSSTVSNASFNSSSNAGTVIAPEHIWLNEGRREQIKRGLYVLVEELLDQTSLEINADSEVFKKIREANFKMVLPRDFKLLLDGLAEQLKNIRIQTGADSLFARYASPIQKQEYSHPEIELFCQEEVPQTQDDFQQLTIFRRNETKHAFKTLTVLPDFYKLTGRPMSSTSSAPEPQQTGGRLSESQILGKLNSNERVLRREALSRLRQEKTLISPDINTQLCRIFITERNSPLRLEAVGLIQGPAASAAIFQAVDRKAIDQCIAVETDPKLLQEFIRLIHDGATFDTKNQQAGTEILLQLLGRHKRAATNKNQTQILPSATLPEAIQLQAISALVNITDQDVLEQVLQTFDKNRDIPDQLLPPLRHLEAKAQHDLIELFLSLDFTAISSNTLRSILKGKTYPQLMYLWTVAVARKNQAIGQQELICLLQQKNILSTTEPSPNEVVSWLNSTNWDSMDQRILNTALTESPELLYRLERIIDKDKRERLTLASRAAEAARTYGKGNPTAPSAADNTARTAQANPALSPSATEPRPENRATTTQYRGNGWLTALSALAMVAIYFSVRFDLPPQADLNYQLITRFLEVMYAYTGLVALGACIMLLSPLFIRNPGTPNSRDAFITLSIVLSIAVVCFVVQYHYFPLTITGWGETALVVLLMSISAVPTAVWYISKWDSSRRPVPPQN